MNVIFTSLSAHSLDDSKEKALPLSPEKTGEASVIDNGSTLDSNNTNSSIGNTTMPESEMFSISLHFIDSSSVSNGAAPRTPSLNSSSPSTASSGTSVSASGTSTSADPSPNTTATSVSAADLPVDSLLSGSNPLTFHLLCPATATVGMLQKFVRLKFDLNSTNSTGGNKFDVNLFCGDFFDDALPSSYTLHDVACISLWRRNAPLEIAYSIFIYPPDGSTSETNGNATPARSGSENHNDNRSLTNGLSNSHRNNQQTILNGVA